MATLTAAQKAEVRMLLSKFNDTINYNKSQINAALQVIEDWYENSKATVSSSVDTATSPFTFTAAQKKKIAAYWMMQKALRELT